MEYTEWNTVFNFMAAAIKAIQEATREVLGIRGMKCRIQFYGRSHQGHPRSIFNLMAAAIKAIQEATLGLGIRGMEYRKMQVEIEIVAQQKYLQKKQG